MGGDRVPTFRIGARGIVARQTAAEAAFQTREFRREHHDARLARRDGDVEHAFPYVSYEMRVRHRATVASQPKLNAFVTAPGPLLCDIQAEFAAGTRLRAREQLHTQAVKLLDDVRDAVHDEAQELCDHADLDFDSPTRSNLAPSSGRAIRRAPDDDNDRRAVVARQRVVRSHETTRNASPRIIVLRDRRLGRPSISAKRHGADPPS